MSKTRLIDLFFYRGKYRTEEGLKRALIKDGRVWTSPLKNYYLWDKYFEYYCSSDYLKDMCEDYGYITEDEAKHFNKWLKDKIASGEITKDYTQWYHCDENEGVGTREFWETLESIRNSYYTFEEDPDEYVEDAEATWNEYAESLNEEEYQKFDRLPEDKQYRIAMKWRIAQYKKLKEANV